MIFIVISLGPSAPLYGDEFALLASNHEALQRRISMIEQAEGDICMACYRVDSSQVPMALLTLLRHRAEAGVRVRVIVDGFVSRIPSSAQRFLAAGGVEIRVFHPLFQGRLDWLNRRMHSKLLVVDRSALLIGSRNLTDHHFGLQDTHFVDCDAYLTGHTCQQAADYFDWLWASPDVCAISHCWATDNAVETQTCSQIRGDEMTDPAEALARLPSRTQAQCDDSLPTASCQVGAAEFCLLHDLELDKSRMTLANQVLAMVDSAQETLIIESPYPAFSHRFLEALKRAAKRKVAITVLTNSLASTDQVIVYAAYHNQKAALMRHGVRLFEFSGPEHLHAKGMVVDDRVAMLGSYNFDARSERLNLEICVATTNPQAVSLIKQSMLERQRRTCSVGRLHVVDVVGRSEPARRAHVRTAQWFAPLLRPLL